jgi:glucokinase
VSIYIGCDLGGSNIKAGMVNLKQGSVLNADNVLTNSRDGHDAVMGRVVDLLRFLISGSGLDQSIILGIG